MVMAIIGFISAVAAPRIGSTIDNVRLRAAARKCAAVLRYARSMAIATQKECTVTFTLHFSEGEQDSYSFDKVSFKERTDDGEESEEEGYGEENRHTKNAERITKKVTLHENITLDWQAHKDAEWSNSGDYPVIFYPRGFTSGGEILFSRVEESKRKYILSVDPITGRIKILEG